MDLAIRSHSHGLFTLVWILKFEHRNIFSDLSSSHVCLEDFENAHDGGGSMGASQYLSKKCSTQLSPRGAKFSHAAESCALRPNSESAGVIYRIWFWCFRW